MKNLRPVKCLYFRRAMFACIPKRCYKVSIAEQKKGAVVQVDITVKPASCLPAEKVVITPLRQLSVVLK